MWELNVGWILLFIFGSIAIIGLLALLIGQIVVTYFLDADYQYGSTYYKRCDLKHKIIENIITSFLALLFVATTSLVLSFGITGILNDYNREYDNKVYDIVSLERNSEVHGSFALGYGHVDECPVYYFYIETDNGYKLESLGTEYTYIQENDDIEPSIYHYKKSGEFYSYYTIYCPTNTIVRDYKA